MKWFGAEGRKWKTTFTFTFQQLCGSMCMGSVQAECVIFTLSGEILKWNLIGQYSILLLYWSYLSSQYGTSSDLSSCALDLSWFLTVRLQDEKKSNLIRLKEVGNWFTLFLLQILGNSCLNEDFSLVISWEDAPPTTRRQDWSKTLFPPAIEGIPPPSPFWRVKTSL